MSLASSPDGLMRPEDKALRMLFTSTEEPIHNSFDDFFDYELKEFNNEDNDRASPTIDHFPTADFVPHENPVGSSRVSGEGSPQPWRKGVWCLNSKPTSDLVVGKTRRTERPGQRFISPACLESNNDYTMRSPALVSRTDTKPITASPRPVMFDNHRLVHSTITRDHTLSSTSARVRTSANRKMVGNESWQQGSQNFHLQMPDDGIYLTPHHSVLQANAKVMARNATIAHPSQSPTKYHYPFNHVTRPQNGDVEGTFEAIDPETSVNFSRRKMGHVRHGTRTDASMGHNSGPVWTTESLHSSDSSNNSQGSQYSHESYQLPHNWHTLASNMPILFAAHNLESEIAAPTPQGIPHQVLYHQQDPCHSTGLGIHYANADDIGVAVSYEPKYEYENEFRPLTPPPPPPPQLTTIPPVSYPPLPPYPLHAFPDTSPFTTPRRRTTTSPSRSRSSSLSPSRHPSHTFTHRSPTRQDQPRRKSLHKPGPIPIKDPPFHDRDDFTTISTPRTRARSTSRPRAPRTPRTPKTPTTTTGFAVDFVNYTPKDSAKLMSDVAPSGSSKTRARREQEAKEKRKRLSEAAVLAVRRAGGDVSVLGEIISV